jgi:hypothetical protein
MRRLIAWLTLLVMLIWGMSVPVSQAQTAPAVSVYSIWVRLSLRGYSQEEIESVLRNMDAKTVDDVKARLRRTVLSNLRLKKVRERFLAAREKGDLQDVVTSIETEIRFAGLENDPELKSLIQERFGIPIERL